MKKLILIDGYGFVFRAYHSLPDMIRHDKTPIGAVYGFLKMMLNILENMKMTHCAVVLDSGGKTFRNDMYQEYKANRPPCPENLIPQFEIIREAIESLNLATLQKQGFEADDIIATIARNAEKEGFEVVIVSSDKDLMQLIDGNILMFDPMKAKIIGKNEVIEKFGVEPRQIIDFLSLLGDASDNIPGVKGVGNKTACELLKEFDNLENLLENYQEIKSDRKRELIKSGFESARLSKSLVKLDENVVLNVEINDLILKDIDAKKLLNFLAIQGFASLFRSVKNKFKIDDINYDEIAKQQALELQKNYQQQNQVNVLNNEEDYSDYKNSVFVDLCAQNTDFRQCLMQIRNSGEVVIEAEDNGANKYLAFLIKNQSSLVLFYCFSNDIFNLLLNLEKDNQAKYLSQKIPENLLMDDLFANLSPSANKDYNDNNHEIILLLQQIIEDESVNKLSFNSKWLLKRTAIWHNFESSKLIFDDVGLIFHLASGKTNQDLIEIATIFYPLSPLIAEFNQLSTLLHKNKNDEISDKKPLILKIMAIRAYFTSLIYQKSLAEILQKKLSTLYQKLEKPLLMVLAYMEKNGILLDLSKANQLSQEFALLIDSLTKEIYNLAGCEFNIASPKQLSEILFNKMQIKFPEELKSSNKKEPENKLHSTNAEILSKLSDDGFKIAGLLLEFRHLSKLKNTYLDALPKEINPNSKRIHTTFLSNSTITGRLSSRNPNLQNIPIKTKEGKMIRRCFIAGSNKILISADYSQVELRILAHLADIESLIYAFNNNQDIHLITASQIFELEPEKIYEDLRRKAKAINFGIIYGISGFGLAKQLNIKRGDASNYIKAYFAKYDGVKQYIDKTIEQAKEQKSVKTIFGRNCLIENIDNKNSLLRLEAERLAVNATIQGSASDIIKKAMINLKNIFYKKQLEAKILLQIHDELIIEAEEKQAHLIAEIVKETMSDVIKLKVPLKVDIAISKHW